MMNITIRGDKVSITDAIREQVNAKLNKLNKYFESPETINVVVNIKVNNLSQKIEVTIPTKQFTIRAEESSEDLYISLDLVIDKLERQIRKNKTRIKNKYKNSEAIDFNFNYESENEETNESKIVKIKNIDSKPMDEEEAILQYELLGHDFFVFKNSNEECTSILYKRKDGNYGMINVK
ncbi:MAG: ribosome-associated translation inhibitor RaiA [Bacilli bacterium]|nr:ribosome-associated translation inhibitor RaiA [Bacilli bacterium]